MMAGKPAVCFAGAAKGVTHGWTRGSAGPRLGGFGEAMAHLLRDPVLAARLGAAARQTALERFDWAVLCRAVERIYDEMLTPGTAPGRVEESPALKKTAASARDSL